MKDYTHIYIFLQKKQLSTIGGSDIRDGVQRLITATINPIFLYEYNACESDTEAVFQGSGHLTSEYRALT